MAHTDQERSDLIDGYWNALYEARQVSSFDSTAVEEARRAMSENPETGELFTSLLLEPSFLVELSRTEQDQELSDGKDELR